MTSQRKLDLVGTCSTIRKTSKKNARYYSRDYCLLPFLFNFFFRKVISVDRSEHTSRRRALAKMLSPQSQSDQKSLKSSLLTFTLVSEPPGKEGSSINVTPCHFSYKVSYKIFCKGIKSMYVLPRPIDIFRTHS